jgi:hypothetical protein
MGRIAGKGSVGEGVKETWRTGVVFIMVWIVVRLYTAVVVSFEGPGVEELGEGTLMLVAVDCIMYIFGVFQSMADHVFD